MKKFLLNIYFWPMFVLVTMIAILLSPVVLIVNLIFFRLPTDRLLRKGIRVYGWFIVRVIPFMAPVTVEDKSGGFSRPAIFTPNHCSSIDPYLFGILPVENAFITTWPFQIPIFKWFMRVAHYINASHGWQGVQEQGEALLNRGCSLIVWPEGHRTRDGRLQRFRRGAFTLACHSGRSIVPVCITGSGKVMPPGSRLLNPGRIKIILLPPVTPDPNTTPEYIQEIRRQVRSAIGQELVKQGQLGKETLQRQVSIGTEHFVSSSPELSSNESA